MNHHYFMSKAIDLAIQNMRAGKGGPFAALVVRDNVIIAEGTNQVTSRNDPTAHAEIVAIREACRKLRSFQLKRCVIYTNCEPCPMCLGAIYWARPAKLYFAATRDNAAKVGFDNAYIYEQSQLPIARRAIAMEQLMRTEALAAFREWDSKPDKSGY